MQIIALLNSNLNMETLHCYEINVKQEPLFYSNYLFNFDFTFLLVIQNILTTTATSKHNII